MSSSEPGTRRGAHPEPGGSAFLCDEQSHSPSSRCRRGCVNAAGTMQHHCITQKNLGCSFHSLGRVSLIPPPSRKRCGGRCTGKEGAAPAQAPGALGW